MSGYFADSRRRADHDLLIKSALVASLLFFALFGIGAVSLLGGRNSKVESLITDISGVKLSAEKVAVLVPVDEIESGSALEPLMFRTEERRKDDVPPEIVTSFDQIEGHFARALILPNHPLRFEHITRNRPINEVTSRIPDGFRGVTIRVDERASIEGWARPGSRVDVTWVSKVLGKPAVTVIVQNSLVISAGRNLNGDYPQGSDAPEELTLLVTTEDARRIMLGQQTGTLSLSLRGLYDNGKGEASTTLTTDDLLGTRRRPLYTVRIIVVGIQDDEGIYEYFHWENNKLVPTTDKGPFA